MKKLQHDNNTSNVGDVSKDHLNAWEERLRVVKGHSFDVQEATNMCLVQDIQFPAKFKIPDFQNYTGASCPKGHLIMYCRKMAAYVSNEKLLIHYFQESLSDAALNCGPYYEKMIGNTSTLFADIVTIGDRVEQGLKSGKIGKFLESQGYKKTFGGNEINVLTSSATPRTAKTSPKAERELDKIPISYTELFPQLVKASMLQPPYPLWYRPKETCDYHAEAAGHSIENCNALKSRVQELINAGQLKFEANTAHIKE
uniref:Uncharacterized protein n=1 Tax=Cajanus cajan TaxID=3821 RepID=A0A151QN37_CAJCA|nr:hypothetical protein KK1_047815 [Cajanus cajan]